MCVCGGGGGGGIQISYNYALTGSIFMNLFLRGCWLDVTNVKRRRVPLLFVWVLG